MTENIWIAIGLVGQFLFSCRFILQWVSSERQKKSVVPVAFWYFSLLGSMTLLSYAIHRLDPVFIIGQAGGFLIYTRNLVLIHQERSSQVPAP